MYWGEFTYYVVDLRFILLLIECITSKVLLYSECSFCLVRAYYSILLFVTVSFNLFNVLTSAVTNSAFRFRVDDGAAELNSALQSQKKHGWSRVAALHCVLLPQLVGKMQLKPPQLDLLARRWQDQCIEVSLRSQSSLSHFADWTLRPTFKYFHVDNIGNYE